MLADDLFRAAPKKLLCVFGHKGKTVTTITGFDLDDKTLNLLSKQLKQHCGKGGSVKDEMVIIQEDL